MNAFGIFKREQLCKASDLRMAVKNLIEIANAIVVSGQSHESGLITIETITTIFIF